MDLIDFGANPLVLALLCLVALVAVLFLYLFVITPALNPLRVLPGPQPSHWLFGSLAEILGMQWSAGHYPEPQLSWVKQYGGVFRFRALLEQRLFVTDPEALKHIFTTNGENYPRGEAIRAFLRDVIGGDGLLSTEGETHHHQRKMLLPHFGFGKIKDFVDVFATHANELCKQLQPFADDPNVSVDMFNYFTKMTLDVIGISAFGFHFNALREESSHVMEALHLLLTPPSVPYILGANLIPTFRQWPLPRLVNERQAKKMLYETVDDVIAAKLKSTRDVHRPVDLVDLMLDENAHVEHQVTAEEARTHVMTFMLAGHETTSTTLAWIFTLFAQHPHAESMARQEARAVTAADGVIGWKSLGELKYITACIQETLRLFPTVSTLASRVAEHDDSLPTSDGKQIFVPKGTVVAFSTAAMHRNSKYWSQPQVYLPDRFIEGTAAFAADRALRQGQGMTYFYMPFSAGAKNCIGMRFAMAELQVIVANLLLHYSFRLTENANVHPKMIGLSIKPVKLDMTIHSVCSNESRVCSRSDIA
ncbi:unnamed protein product [Aphanomyces euteiches]|uniref:Cytochrome P450 n=1 Tax=Aphanomyces euteiches TaxID=100861 RepID=A0A6G0W8Z9_9STRA|nr:hypothetical protein Ae201684_018182 [Aphanomyces euteiches]KAH9076656.1 hypothetical protein Ae201684P_010595 [Aphanomyces euteiches]KAH9155072.1 hypothetical protein AeRB84_002931 [Aphanomyces euteiches]